jgi:hypothetical protein
MEDQPLKSQSYEDRNFVASLEKGLLVIEAFDANRPRLTLSDVAKLTGMTRAAARRYLLTLTKLTYAEFDGRYFSLTPRILRLGYAYLSSASLSAQVQPFLEQISEETGESSSAAILDGDDIVYVARSATRRIMSIGLPWAGQSWLTCRRMVLRPICNGSGWRLARPRPSRTSPHFRLPSMQPALRDTQLLTRSLNMGCAPLPSRLCRRMAG